MVQCAGLVSINPKTTGASNGREKLHVPECDPESTRGKRKRVNECGTISNTVKRTCAALKEPDVSQTFPRITQRASVKPCTGSHSSGEVDAHKEPGGAIDSQVAWTQKSQPSLQHFLVGLPIDSYRFQHLIQPKTPEKATAHTECPSNEEKSTLGVVQVFSRNSELDGSELARSSVCAHLPRDNQGEGHISHSEVNSSIKQTCKKEEPFSATSTLVQNSNCTEHSQHSTHESIGEDCTSGNTEYAVSFTLSAETDMCSWEELIDSCDSAALRTNRDLQDDTNTVQAPQKTQEISPSHEHTKQDKSPPILQPGTFPGIKREADGLTSTIQDGNQLDQATKHSDLSLEGYSKLFHKPDVFDVLRDAFSKKGDSTSLALCKLLEKCQCTMHNCK